MSTEHTHPPEGQDPSPVAEETPTRKRSYLRRVGIVFLLLLLILGGVLFWGWFQLKGSLPILDGELAMDGLEHPVRVERDRLGIPSIFAQNRRDLSRALGFLHGQDRFFQMDLLRRLAAGELSEIFGPMALERDRETRVHRLRRVAAQVLESAPDDLRREVEAYAEGVNQGLAQLKVRPFEYLALGVKPRPWLPEDSVLVILAMALDLQEENGGPEAELDLMYATLPSELVEFLNSKGTPWDAPVVGEPLVVPPIPAQASLDLRGGAQGSPGKSAVLRRRSFPPNFESFPNATGSNSWAVSGAHSPYSGGMLANDMHLNFGVPCVWYRADLHLEVPGQDGGLRMTGVTLPGTPSLTVGSNGSIAWGYTNSYGDWSDLIRLEPDPADPDRYLTADGSKALQIYKETIQVKGAPAEELPIRWSQWGPVVRRDAQGRELVCRWIGQFPEAINLEQINLGYARNVEEALAIANRSGIPAQNFVTVDTEGNLGWTIAGRIPLRSGNGERVSPSSDATEWTGWLDPADYPRVVNPPDGRLWTANARVVDGEMLQKIGFGGYALGARAKQIHDRLLDRESFDERAFLAIQLDDEARFLQPWRNLLLELLKNAPETQLRVEARTFIENWGDHASVDSVGYRLVRGFRGHTFENVLGALVAPCREKEPDFDTRFLKQAEGAMWRLLQVRPKYLLPPAYETWDDWLLACFDEVPANLMKGGGSLAEKTWGQRNTLDVEHPMSSSIPVLGKRLRLPSIPLPGDRDMPRVQSISFGSSERLVVAPGHEENGIFHMPGGQSGHPLSPYFRAGFDAWAEGEPTPFLPGAVEHTLILRPSP